jgi:hypothetical protein
MRRKYQRTKDSFGRTFSKNYISKHEFLPPRKLPANLYPMFIQKFPRFRGRNPSSNPIIFNAKPGETASTFKNRVDRLFKNYRQAFYKKEYILARRNNKYRGSMKDHITEYKEKQAAREQAAAKQAHQTMVSLANSKSRKQCELIQKQIQSRRAKGLSSTALDADFNRLCKGQTKQLVMRDALLAKRRRVFTQQAKSMNKADVAEIREELDKYKRGCAAKGLNFSGRKNSSGQYICDDKPKSKTYNYDLINSRWVKNPTKFTGNQTIDNAALSSAAKAQWNSVPLNEKIRRCRAGGAKLAAAQKVGNTQLAEVLTKNMNERHCAHWIKKGEKAPTNPGSSYF